MAKRAAYCSLAEARRLVGVSVNQMFDTAAISSLDFFPSSSIPYSLPQPHTSPRASQRSSESSEDTLDERKDAARSPQKSSATVAVLDARRMRFEHEPTPVRVDQAARGGWCRATCRLGGRFTAGSPPGAIDSRFVTRI
jgi:hypothetical protein